MSCQLEILERVPSELTDTVLKRYIKLQGLCLDISIATHR